VNTFEILTKATGVAFLRNHSIVENEDCITAMKIKDMNDVDSIFDKC
jgi:hypothetical protein